MIAGGSHVDSIEDTYDAMLKLPLVVNNPNMMSLGSKGASFIGQVGCAFPCCGSSCRNPGFSSFAIFLSWLKFFIYSLLRLKLIYFAVM